MTLTLQSSLTWDGGGAIRLVLGADQAGSDLLEISGALIRGDTSGGLFVFDLVDAGAVAGQTYDFVHFGSIEGFSVSDFAFTGVAGTFAIQDGELGFTVSAGVPEPSAVWLTLLPGAALLLLRRAAGRRRAAA